MRLITAVTCTIAAVAFGRSDHLLNARRSISIRTSSDATAFEHAPPANDHNDETHLHETHPHIWKHEMPFSIEATFALLWISLIASIPLILPVLTGKPITNTQASLAVSMWAALFGGVYLFTNIIKFNSAHFETVRCLTLVECIYLMSQVITTVGYGDITPALPRGQVFVALYVVAAMLVIAMLVSDLAQYLISKADMYEKKLALKAEQDALVFRRSRTGVATATKPTVVRPSSMPVVRSVVIFAVFAFIGILFFHFFPGEGKTWFQATYMSIITLSTVGFGAFTPSTEMGKVFAAFWMVFGCSALVSVVTSFTELMVNMNEYERYDNVQAMEPFLAYKQKLNVDRVDKITFLKLALVHKGMASPEDIDGLGSFFKSLQPDSKDNCLDRGLAEDTLGHSSDPSMRPVIHSRSPGSARKTPRSAHSGKSS